MKKNNNNSNSNKKKSFSSSLSSLKFMQRARAKTQGEASSSGGENKSAKEAAASEAEASGTKWTSSGVSGSRGCSITYEADPLPTGRTTGRLSFGKKKVNPEEKAEQVEKTGNGDDTVVNPRYEDVGKLSRDGKQERGNTSGTKKRRFMKPNAKDVKRFKKAKSKLT